MCRTGLYVICMCRKGLYVICMCRCKLFSRAHNHKPDLNGPSTVCVCFDDAAVPKGQGCQSGAMALKSAPIAILKRQTEKMKRRALARQSLPTRLCAHANVELPVVS